MNLSLTETSDLATLWKAFDSSNPLKYRIEEELKIRIRTNNRFSVEYLFDLVVLQKKATQIYFIPGSLSYHAFGEYVTVINFTTEIHSIEELLSNFETGTSSVGPVSCQILQMDSTKRKIRFTTSEVYEVSCI